MKKPWLSDLTQGNLTVETPNGQTKTSGAKYDVEENYGGGQKPAGGASSKGKWSGDRSGE